MSSKKVIAIGGNAGGMSTMSQLRRLDGEAEISVFEKGTDISYSACGIPYYIGGMIEERDQLIARTPESFAEQRISVQTKHEVLKIEPAEKTVTVRDLRSGKEFVEDWDMLLVSTGAARPLPPIPGVDADGVFIIHSIDAAVHMRRWIESHAPRRAVIVGGGSIGLEMADVFACMMGLEVTILELAPQLMAVLDADMAVYVQENLEAHRVKVHTGASVREIVEADGRVVAVRTDKDEFEADIVIMALGVLPNSALAASAGIKTGVKGAIVVDERMRTSIPGIWSVGDCVQSVNRIDGRPMHLAMGAVANRQGRVAAFDMAGMEACFPGVLGTAVCRVCGQDIARTGLLEREMTADGKEWLAGIVEGGTVAKYMVDYGKMRVKLVVEMPSERIVGAQIVGSPGAAKRIDTMVAAITANMTLEDMMGLDFCYAPPISPLWDPLQQCARTLLSKLEKLRKLEKAGG